MVPPPEGSDTPEPPNSNSAEDHSTDPPELGSIIAAMPEHIKDMFLRSCTHLTHDEAAQFGQLLILFEDIFAQTDTDLGLFTQIHHTIDTGDASPIKQCMRRVPLGFVHEEDAHLQKMLECGVIQPSTSPWASPSVLVCKKDGGLQWCIDFCAVNTVTRKDAYPLPLIEECLNTLQGTQFMSALDMQSGYWQIKMHPDNHAKTAFLTKHGLFEFTQMPFGLCNAQPLFNG